MIDMDDCIAFVKIEPKQEEEINLSLEQTMLVKNDDWATIKNEHETEYSEDIASCDYDTNVKIVSAKHPLEHNIFSKKFKCDICNYATNVKSNLTRHQISHKASNNFKCGICGYAAKQKRTLTKHVLTHIVFKDLNFKCDLSEYFSNYKKAFKLHLSNYNSTNFKSHNCDYQAHIKRYLQQHLLLLA